MLIEQQETRGESVTQFFRHRDLSPRSFWNCSAS